jgi:HEPN domain-containing protein
MSFEWTVFKDNAQRFYELGLEQTERPEISEGLFRSCISRAYYSAYQYAKEYLINIGSYYPSQDESRSDHIYVINRFNLVKDQKASFIFNDLNWLRRYRVASDYSKAFEVQGQKPNTEKSAKEALNAANRVIENIKKLQRQK